MGYIDHSPADAALDVLLPTVRRQVQHREALPHADVKNAIAKIRNSEGKRAARLAFEFLILTAARSGEVRFATWAEIDVDAKTWTIPADRMKAKRDHVVPLSEQALAVLAQARFLWQDDEGWPWKMPEDGVIFPHPITMRRLSENIFSDRIRKSKLGCDAHGFRSSFRDWATETMASSYEVIELCLAHRVGTAVTAAYFRADLLEQRRELAIVGRLRRLNGVTFLVLQRRFKEECRGMHEGRLGAWHGSAWPVRWILASPRATVAAQPARTVPGAASPAPPGRPAAS